jgi:cell division protein FtsB
VLHEVWLFIRAVWSHWTTLLTGGVVSVVALALDHFTKVTVPPRVVVALMSVFLLVALFQAWSDQYRDARDKSLAAERLELDKKTLQARLEAKEDEIDHLRDELVRRPPLAKVQIIEQATPERRPVAPRELIVTGAKPVASDLKDAPEAIEFTIQTTARIQPTLLAVKCDGEITRGTFRMGDVSYFMAVREGYGEGGTVYWFSFQQPPFDPATPLVVMLMAKRPIQVLKIERRSTPPQP